MNFSIWDFSSPIQLAFLYYSFSLSILLLPLGVISRRFRIGILESNRFPLIFFLVLFSICKKKISKKFIITTIKFWIYIYISINLKDRISQINFFFLKKNLFLSNKIRIFSYRFICILNIIHSSYPCSS